MALYYRQKRCKINYQKEKRLNEYYFFQFISNNLKIIFQNQNFYYLFKCFRYPKNPCWEIR